jgi:hypothetical protein
LMLSIQMRERYLRGNVTTVKSRNSSFVRCDGVVSSRGESVKRKGVKRNGTCS